MNLSLELVKSESKKTIIMLVVSTLGSISALAWNKAFVDIISRTPFLKRYGLWVYAFLITIIYVNIMLTLTKKNDDEKE